MNAAPDANTAPCEEFLDALGRDLRVLCVKAYRVELRCAFPVIPCLDHEAQLRGRPAPHISAYLEDARGELHEVGLVPAEKRITVDGPSTMAETSEAGRDAMLSLLAGRFPGHAVVLKQPSLLRGDRRVAEVVRSQLRLRDVLEGPESSELRWSLEKLKAISDLMEKESRVFSWGTRTLTPILGGAGVATYLFIGMFRHSMTPAEIDLLRSAAVGTMTLVFLYYGLMAVYLTGLGTRVWKRATEYKLILDARRQRAEASRAGAGAGAQGGAPTPLAARRA